MAEGPGTLARVDTGRVHRLRNTVQHYAWGSRTAIPELLGEPSPSGDPCAELWMGAHPKAPSEVLLPEGTVPLDRFVAADPEAVLGAAVAKRFDGALPFLLKVLAADAPLSIQAHPSREQAREGFERETRAGIPASAPERCYVDPHPKPELICALGTFRALNRFREPDEIAERFDALGAPELAEPVGGLRRDPGREGLAALLRHLWQLPGPDRTALLARAAERAREDAARDPAWREVGELVALHPGDVGALAPLLLNLVTLEPGEAMYLPAGELHSYLGGVGIEIMASSDNVLRGGLTRKHVDVPELMRTLTFASGPVEVLTARPAGPSLACYDTPAREFALARIGVGPGRPFSAAAGRAVEILLCTAGAGRIEGAGSLAFGRGGSFLVPAAAPAYRIEGDAVLYRATVAAWSVDSGRQAS